MKEIELKVPNLGEAEDTEIIEISVKKGDKLNKNDPIIVLESEKAAMEVPSDHDGIIKEIRVKEGDSVKEGVVFAVMEVEDTEKTKISKYTKENFESLNLFRCWGLFLAKIFHDVLDYHTYPFQAAEIARDAGVKHLLFYHIVPPLDVPGLETLWTSKVKGIFKNYTIGKDGMLFSLPANSDSIDTLKDSL